MMPPVPIAVKVEGLQVEFSLTDGRSLRVLNGVEFTVAKGSFLAILGPSGSGKTTLLRSIAGLISPLAGSVDLGVRGDRDQNHTLPPLSMVFQRPVLLPWLNVEENALLPFRIQGLPLAKDVEERLHGLFAMVGLYGFRSAMPHELSGGMQMRAAMVRSFITAPEIVLMDEPFAALDEVTRHRLDSELLKLWARDKCTILYVTHNIQEAVYLADRIVVLSHRPARVIEEVSVPLDRPRVPTMRESRRYFELVNTLYACIGHG